MRRFVILITCLALALSLAPAFRAPAAAQSAASAVGAIQRATPSVLGLLVTDADGHQTIGTAIAYSAEGHLVTAAHRLAGATAVQVRLPDGQWASVDLQRHVWWDPWTDVAVIHLPDHRLTPAAFADSTQLKQGDLAIVLGHTMRLERRPATTAGVVSGFERRYGFFKGMLQIDAPVNQGNGGGPVVNQHGEVIGMVLAVASADVEGLGLALPSNAVREIADRLIEQKDLKRPWLYADLDNTGLVNFGWPGATGVEVWYVYPGTPAVGVLTPGAVITAVNDTAIRDLDHLWAVLEPFQPGTRVSLELETNGVQTRKDLVLGSHPPLLGGGRAGGPAPDGEEESGIWTHLSEAQAWEARDYADWAYPFSFEQFASVYLAESPRGYALLETEFMRLAYAAWRHYRLPGAEDPDLYTVQVRARGNLYVRVVFGMPLDSSGTPNYTLRQGAKVIASGPILYAEGPEKAGIPRPLAGEAAAYRWVGAVIQVPSQGVDPRGDLTLIIGPETAPVATFTWELRDLQ